MEVMFPLNKASRGVKGFLDQVVDVDEDTVGRREGVSAAAMGVLRQISSLENFEGGYRGGRAQQTNGTGLALSHVTAGVEPTSTSVVQARGKTVRELSRLWRYVGGGSPGTVTVACPNGTINGAPSTTNLSKKQ